MRKKITLALVFLCVAGLLAYGAWRRTYSFTGTVDFDCDAATVVTNGMDFDSATINIKNPADMPNVAAIMIEFIPDDEEDIGTLDFDFEVCHQDKLDATHPGIWSLLREEFDTRLISIPHSTPPADEATIRVTVYINVMGVSHIRLKEVENTSAASDVTDILVRIAF